MHQLHPAGQASHTLLLMINSIRHAVHIVSVVSHVAHCDTVEHAVLQFAPIKPYPSKHPVHVPSVSSHIPQLVTDVH